MDSSFSKNTKQLPAEENTPTPNSTNREKLKEYLRWRLSLSDEEFAKYVQERKREWKEEWKESFKDLKVYPGDFRLLEKLFGEENSPESKK